MIDSVSSLKDLSYILKSNNVHLFVNQATLVMLFFVCAASEDNTIDRMLLSWHYFVIHCFFNVMFNSNCKLFSFVVAL